MSEAPAWLRHVCLTLSVHGSQDISMFSGFPHTSAQFLNVLHSW